MSRLLPDPARAVTVGEQASLPSPPTSAGGSRAAYRDSVDQEISAAEISVCPLCGTEVDTDEGPAVVAVDEWAADDLLPALAVMSCPNPACPPQDAEDTGLAG